MAFPAVVNTNESNLLTAGTAHTVNLPGSIVAGNLLIVFLVKGSVAATINAVGGWTEVADENLARGLYCAAREADGAEGATLGLTSSAATKSVHVSYQISGAEDPATQLPQLSTVATGVSPAQPDATTCTPTGGAKDYLWITIHDGGNERGDVDGWAASPSGYGAALQKTAGTAGTNTGCEISTATRTNNAASEDAGAWTITAPINPWRAWTMAVHPSSAPPPAEIPSLVTARR